MTHFKCKAITWIQLRRLFLPYRLKFSRLITSYPHAYVRLAANVSEGGWIWKVNETGRRGKKEPVAEHHKRGSQTGCLTAARLKSYKRAKLTQARHRSHAESTLERPTHLAINEGPSCACFVARHAIYSSPDRCVSISTSRHGGHKYRGSLASCMLAVDAFMWRLANFPSIWFARA
jgi:hypothetical protein